MFSEVIIFGTSNLILHKLTVLRVKDDVENKYAFESH